MNCLSCKSTISNNISSKKWAIVKILDLKQRGFNVTGFPHAGFVTVRGWRLAKVDEFTTNLCANCVNTNIEKIKSSLSLKSKNYKKRQKFLNFLGPIFGLAILIFIDYSLGLNPNKSPTNFENYITIFGIFLIFSPIIHIFSNPKLYDDGAENSDETTTYKFHRTFIGSYQKQPIPFLNTNVFPLILHPEPSMPGPYVAINMQFTVPDKALTEYSQSENERGWSRIDYFAKFGTSAPGPYDKGLQLENKKNFGFNHWGEFLSKPIDELKTIEGVSDIKN